MDCPSPDTLAGFYEGRLAAAEDVEGHLDRCPSCRAAFVELGRSLSPRRAESPKRMLAPVAGDLFAGRYRIVRFIAQGGMGAVYEASDVQLGTQVAVKLLRIEQSDDPDAKRRFKREVALARAITHPNVCRLYDFGLATDPSGREIAYLTMELLDGATLAHHLRQEGAMSPVQALSIAQQLAEGLTAAHQAGVVHRDFKSLNVMLVPCAKPGKFRAVITDFGLAQATGSLAQNLASSKGAIVGTPVYMAPEQLAGEPATAKSDLWAFGVVLREMVTGAHPADARAIVADPSWEAAIKHCREPKPEERPANALCVVASLRAPASAGVPSEKLATKRRTQARVDQIFVTALALCLAALALVALITAGPSYPRRSANSEKRPRGTAVNVAAVAPATEPSLDRDRTNTALDVAILGTRGARAIDAGELENGTTTLATAFAKATAGGHFETAVVAAVNLSEGWLHAGHLAKAEAAGNDALAIARRTNNLNGIALALDRLGRVALAKDEPQRAVGFYTQARLEVGSRSSFLVTALLRVGFAHVELERGDYRSASALARSAREAFVSRKDWDRDAEALTVEALALLAEKRDWGLVREWFETTVKNKSRLHEVSAGLELTIASGRVATADGKFAEAQRILQAAAEQARKQGFVAMGLQARLALAECHRTAGSPEATKLFDAVAKDATRDGFLLIARKASAVR